MVSRAKSCPWLMVSLCLGCATAPSARSGQGAALPSAVPSSAASPVLARADGLTLTEADLARYVEGHPKVARQLYDLRHTALEEMTLDSLVEAAARRSGQPPEDWLRAEVERQVQPPSDSEVKAYFESRLVGENRNYRFEEIGPQIRDHLIAQRRQEALAKLLERLKSDAHLASFLPPPRVSVAADGPAKGPSAAPITIVEFSDYECPFCQRQEAALKELLAAYPGQVRLVVRDFPLDMHPDARRAAHAAVCADRQGRFWEMHDRLFGASEAVDLSEAGLQRTAKAVGLDLLRFNSCVASPEAEAAVAESQRAGESAGVDGTPALFLNGRPFSGAVSFAELKATVDEELSLTRRTQAAANAAKGN